MNPNLNAMSAQEAVARRVSRLLLRDRMQVFATKVKANAAWVKRFLHGPSA
jgi:hypothetical protein